MRVFLMLNSVFKNVILCIFLVQQILQALSGSNATTLFSHSALHQLSTSQAHGNPVNRYSALQ